MRSSMLKIRFRPAAAIALASALLLTGGAEAHEEYTVHRGLTKKALSVQTTSFYTSAMKSAIETGSVDEDHQDLNNSKCILPVICPSSMRHFFNPWNDEGLWGYASALESAAWHWDQAAIAFKSHPTDTAYNKAFHLLGQILHLLEDAGVPAHVHLDAHPGDDFESWGKQNYAGYTYPAGLAPITPAAGRVEYAVEDLAWRTYNLSSFEGVLTTRNPQPASELHRMFPGNRLEYDTLWGRWEIDDVGTWDGMASGDDEWWPCDDRPGYYYLENIDTVRPAVFEKKLTYATFTVGMTLPQVYGRELYPWTVRHAAGVLTAFANGIRVTDPSNTGVTWTQGSNVFIRWNGFSGDHVKIELWKGSSLKTTIAATTPNDGLHPWFVPATQEVGSDYRIKIISLSNAAVNDFSDNYFAIVAPPKLTVGYPSASGVSWKPGQSYTITWTSSGAVGSAVKIELWKGSRLKTTIAASTTNDGSHPWTVPLSQTPGNDYRIRIISTANTGVNDFSDNYFSIAK